MMQQVEEGYVWLYCVFDKEVSLRRKLNIENYRVF